MKIAIIGTHSTGKSTLIEKLKSALKKTGKQILVVQEMARDCPLTINEKTNLKAQKWIMHNQIKKELAVDHTNKILITDRATIDNFAYLYRVADETTRKIYEKIAFDHSRTYDFIFKTKRLDIKAKADGVRATDENFRKFIDDTIYSFLKKHQINFVELTPTVNYKTHIQNIQKIIST